MLSQPKCVLISFIVFCVGCEQKNESDQARTTSNKPTATTETPINTVSLDKSPLDLTYYPEDFPQLKMSGNVKEDIVARVIYSRPKKEGRIIFGNILKYGSRWRLGANEATEIEFFKDVTIQNTVIRKNRYVLYCIPYENRWTIIFNNDLFTWGLKIDSTKDAFKFDIPVQKTPYPLEHFTMEFKKADSGMFLSIAWDSVSARLPITY